MLKRFLNNLPANTELEISTMSYIAKPRLSMVAVRDLFPTNKRVGIVNFSRDTKAENARRKWYMFPAVADFSIQPNSNTVTKPSFAWERIASKIAAQ